MERTQPIIKMVIEFLNDETLAQIIEITRLEQIEKIKIRSGTFWSRMITGLLHSKATAIGKTIYYREGILNTDSPDLELLTHELVHIRQCQENTTLLFLIKYVFTYVKQTVGLTIEAWKANRRPGWKSFKNAFRQAWWKVHFEQEAVAAEKEYRKKFGRKAERNRVEK